MTNPTNSLIPIKNLTIAQLINHIRALDEQQFRVQQLIKWMYQKRFDSFELMNNIPKKSILRFKERYSLKKLSVRYCLESKTGDAVKFGFESVDNTSIIESVLLFDNKRRTACLSSQLGCGLGCVFCETGRMGYVRNLRQDEMIGQLIGMNDYLSSKGDKTITNIVFMGMGEALSNFDTFMSSLEIIMHNDAFNIGGRRITVSTAGVIPSIEKLMEKNLNIGLAISLNSFSNKHRNVLMPINRKYPIEALVDIAKRYAKKIERPVTFEYVLIEGENDSSEAITSLVSFLKGFNCKINIIPINTSSGYKAKIPSEQALQTFADALHSRGLSVTVRRSKGADISGACGQLCGSLSQEAMSPIE